MAEIILTKDEELLVEKVAEHLVALAVEKRGTHHHVMLMSRKKFFEEFGIDGVEIVLVNIGDTYISIENAEYVNHLSPDQVLLFAAIAKKIVEKHPAHLGFWF